MAAACNKSDRSRIQMYDNACVQQTRDDEIVPC